MPSRKKVLKIYLADHEMEEVRKISTMANVSKSSFGQRCVLGRQLPDSHRQKDILALLKINSDLARLGNLQKMILDDEDVLDRLDASPRDLDELICFIRENQGTLKRIALTIKLPGKGSCH